MKAPSHREETIFHALLQLPPEGRAAGLTAACGGDPELLARVSQLLEAHARSEEFFNKQAMGIATGEELPTQAEPPTDGPGTIIGRYKLREKIGEGGCGIVYVAEQEEPVRRRVALKVIKLGMDTKSVIARFDAERQALAMMDHPNIAKVLDAGATETGRPYFVMELVRGIKITDYCDQNNLATRERLDLFIKVCQAVQHAHQKGIIHRDLKPSNILVTLHDGTPVPKVIDFGIAKATEGRLTDLTIYTELYQFIGTPAYMSPEQAEMSGLDIDTRSDIYSLGVLLYELLTGRPPFDAKELIDAGLDEMRRTIREKEPSRPSTRLSTMSADELTTTAKRRAIDGHKLVHLLRGDLDWIVMKALEKDRTRRYETANGFAADLLRHLSNEPVIARPPSTLYRFQKAVRRNRLAYSAAGAVAAALVFGLISTQLQAARARRAEALATKRLAEVSAERDAKEQARKDAEEISKFLQEVFQSPDPARDGRTITVAETLDRAVTRLESDLKNQPDQQGRLLQTLASTYYALGLYNQAIPLQEQVRTWSAQSRNEASKLKAAMNLANSYDRAGRQSDALRLREEVLTLSRNAYGHEHTNVIGPAYNLALSYLNFGRMEEGTRLVDDALAIARKNLGNEHELTVSVMATRAECYARVEHRHSDALKMREELLALNTKLRGTTHPRTLAAMQALAGSYSQFGRHDEAIKLHHQAMEQIQTLYGPEHQETVWAKQRLLVLYLAAGSFGQAIDLGKEILRLSQKLYGPSHSLTAEAMIQLAMAMEHSSRDESLALREQLLSLMRSGAPRPPLLWDALVHLAGNYLDVGRINDAIKHYEEAVALSKQVFGARDETRVALSGLARAYSEGGRLEDAVKPRHEAIQLSRQLYGSNDFRTDVWIHDLAGDYLRAGKRDKCREILAELGDRGIEQWLVLAPIAYQGSWVTALKEEQVPGEAVLRPRHGDAVLVSGKEMTWKAYEGESFILDLDWVLGKRVERAVAYAVCYLVSERDQPGLVMTISSDDQARVYLNGKQVYENIIARGVHEASDKVGGIMLRRGQNAIVLKLVNGFAEWRGSVNFTNADGTPLKAVRQSLDPRVSSF